MRWKKGKRMAVFLAAAAAISLTGCKKEDVQLVEKPGPEAVIRIFATGSFFSTSNHAKYWSEHFSEKTGSNAVIYYDEESTYYAEEGQDGRTILRNRIKSDQPDDMYIVNAEDMIEFSEKGYILDMSDFDFTGNLSDSALQLSTIDGKVYCLPLGYTGFGLYWNVDLLKKYGLEIPRNYGELIKTWDALVEQGITPYAGNKGFGLTVPAMCVSFAEVYQSKDRDRLLAALADGTTPVSAYARKGFELLKLMSDKGYLDPRQAVESLPRSEEEISMFCGGKAACVGACMSTRFYNDPKATGFEVRMTGWPLLEDGCISVVGTEQKLCVNPATGNMDIVKEFVELMGSEEALMQCTEMGKVSSGKVNDASKYLETEREFDELIQSDGQIPNTDMNLKLNLWEDIRDISRLVLSGDATVDDACRMLDEMQAEEIASRKK